VVFRRIAGWVTIVFRRKLWLCVHFWIYIYIYIYIYNFFSKELILQEAGVMCTLLDSYIGVFFNQRT